MEGKRQKARRAAEKKRAEKVRKAADAEYSMEQDLIHGLRNLGFRADEVRRAAEHCRALNGATFEERVRAAIRYVRPKRTSPAQRLE
jgi:Holliday junction resolvasome RuvABC DNA-binding subunit